MLGESGLSSSDEQDLGGLEVITRNKQMGFLDFIHDSEVGHKTRLRLSDGGSTVYMI